MRVSAAYGGRARSIRCECECTPPTRARTHELQRRGTDTHGLHRQRAREGEGTSRAEASRGGQRRRQSRAGEGEVGEGTISAEHEQRSAAMRRTETPGSDVTSSDETRRAGRGCADCDGKADDARHASVRRASQGGTSCRCCGMCRRRRRRGRSRSLSHDGNAVNDDGYERQPRRGSDCSSAPRKRLPGSERSLCICGEPPAVMQCNAMQ
jgi:hypothetical protein